MPVKEVQKVSRDFIAIDRHRLVDEAEEQPKRYYEYAKKLADAKLEKEREEAALDLIRAKLDLDIRSNPTEYNLEKVTEPAIKACILDQKKYKNQLEAVMQAGHLVNVLQAGVTALDHRKRMIEKIVDLHGQNYFAAPRMKRKDRKDDTDDD